MAQGHGRGVAVSADSEVGEHRVAEGIAQNVLRFDVPVQDALVVRVLECPADPYTGGQHLGDRELLPGPEAACQAAPGVELHDDVRLVAREAAGEEIRRSRVLASLPGQRTFVLERPAAARIANRGMQYLDRYLAAHRRLIAPVDGGASTSADHREIGQAGNTGRSIRVEGRALC